MKRRLFLGFLLVPMTGCEITAQFYVEKAWDVSPGFTPTNPDMKTRAQIEFKIPVGKQPIKPTPPSK